MFDKETNLSYEVAEEVKTFFKDKVFRTMIPRNIKLAEAPSFGKSVIIYDEKSKGARAYMALAKEIVENNFGENDLEKDSIDDKTEDKKEPEEVIKNLDENKKNTKENSDKAKDENSGDNKSGEGKEIIDKKDKEADDGIVKKSKFSFDQNKLVNNEKRN